MPLSKEEILATLKKIFTMQTIILLILICLMLLYAHMYRYRVITIDNIVLVHDRWTGQMYWKYVSAHPREWQYIGQASGDP